MSLFAIADTHLSLGTNKAMDAFPGWDGYVQRLQKNWNKVVSPGDYVVIAGDISWAMNFAELEADFQFLHALNGTKILLKGNHDFWWDTRSKIEGFLAQKGFDSIHILHNSAFLAGPDVVCGSRGWMLDAQETADQKILNREVLRLQMSLAAAAQMEGRRFVFLHYPPVSAAGVCEPIVELLQKEGITRCYYGHLHGEAARYSIRQNINGIYFSLISGDYLGFCPILIDKF